MGCFSDTSAAHALPLLLANNSITPQFCESLVSSLALKPTPTLYDYYYVEYHRECYAGNSFSFGTSAVTKVDSEAVVVAAFDDGPYIDEVVEVVIDEP